MPRKSSEEFDAMVSTILPDDVAEETVDTADKTDSDSILAHYTNIRSVSAEEAIVVAETTIERFNDHLAMPGPTQSMALDLFKQYQESEDGEIVLIELYAAASIYCACKVTETPLDPTEVAEAGGELLTEKRLLRRVKKIASGLGLDPSSFIGSTQYVSHYCDELNLDEEVAERAIDIIEQCQSVGLASGKSPSGWAAAAVYNAVLETDDKITQEDIAEVANVSKVTIRNRYKEQRNHVAETGD